MQFVLLLIKYAMKKILFALPFLLFACHKDHEEEASYVSSPTVDNTDTVIAPLPAVPAPDHIIFVWFENKDYTQVIGSPEAPYINSLISHGTLFVDFHALGHPSYPEYIAFFSGTTNNKQDDHCIEGAPYSNLNLFTQLSAKGKTFAWYSEDLPEAGSDVCYHEDYVERHNPTQCFSNVSLKANKRWLDFPADLNKLETVVCISPNLANDMHNGTIREGDDWLRTNCSQLIRWCEDHNAVFVIYFDENNNMPGNRIPVIAVGQPVKANYTDSTYYDHYNWTRTLLSMYGAAPIGNSASRKDITGCWTDLN